MIGKCHKHPWMTILRIISPPERSHGLRHLPPHASDDRVIFRCLGFICRITVHDEGLFRSSNHWIAVRLMMKIGSFGVLGTGSPQWKRRENGKKWAVPESSGNYWTNYVDVFFGTLQVENFIALLNLYVHIH